MKSILAIFFMLLLVVSILLVPFTSTYKSDSNLLPSRQTETPSEEEIMFTTTMATVTTHSYRHLEKIQSCIPIQQPIEPPASLIPALTASYPGSGAKMTWNLIEALTGYPTGDDWYSNGRTTNVISTKTHYPHPQGRLVPFLEQDHMNVRKVVILLRHPLAAIPSYHNYIWEREHDLPPHSSRATVEGWLEWRDIHFEQELGYWRDLIVYWMDLFADSESHLLITYEELVEDQFGPYESKKLTEFLAKDTPMEVQQHIHAVFHKDDEDDNLHNKKEMQHIECIWHAIVKYHETNNKGGKEEENNIRPNPASYRSSGPKERPFTTQQLDLTLEVLKDLQLRYKSLDGIDGVNNGLLVGILQNYINAIDQKTPNDSSSVGLG